MKLGTLKVGLVGCAIAASWLGCTDTHPRPHDKNTNWLQPCDAPDDCGGGLDCIEDVCTRTCDSLEDCSDPELALTCAAGVCAARATMPMAGSSAPVPDASTPARDGSTPVTPDAGDMKPEPSECAGEGGSRKPGPNLYDRNAAGQGDCSGKTLGDVIAAIHAAHPDLEDIKYILDPTMPPPPIVITAQITAFQTVNGFAIVMQRGRGDCESGCTEIEYWYFRTDASCTPQQVGHYFPQYGDSACTLEGYPMWDTPVPPAQYPAACGAPADGPLLEGSSTAKGCGERSACAFAGAEKPEDVTLELQVEVHRDEADPSSGTVTLSGTGNDLLDGRALAATFDGNVVRVEASESLPSTCLMQFSVQLLLDFDGNREGYLRYEEARTPNCTAGADYCKGHLDLTFARPKGCFPASDFITAVHWARAPLLACETDDDCSTVSVGAECASVCQAGVRADAAAQLQQTIEELGAAYCADAGCGIFADCAQQRPACVDGRCTAVRVSP